MNLNLDFNTGEKIIKKIVKIGVKNFISHGISSCKILKRISKKIENSKQLDSSDKELLTNFLYLNAVMDQGRDSLGVKELLIRVTNEAYSNNIRFLHNPDNFFKNPRFFTETLSDEHKQVKQYRSKVLMISGYSLFGTKINPYTMYRWGTVMLCLKKLYEDNKTLLSYIMGARRANSITDLIRNDDEYGLGNAIGFKACKLLTKWIIHTFPIIESTDPKWDQNSYEIPLDSNVGGVFMRSGLLFLFTNAKELWESRCWIKQNNGRVNLSAQRLNDLKITKNTAIENELNEILKRWSLRRRNLMKALNAFILKLNKRNIKATIGQLDDGFIYIGRNFCKRESKPLCNKCPLKNLCLANKKEHLLKTQYYCGVGQGVFF